MSMDENFKERARRAQAAMMMVADMLERVLPDINEHADSPAQWRALHAYGTIGKWVLALKTIDDASQVGVAAAALRGSFEAYLDIILMKHFPEKVEDVAEWERSAILQAIEAAMTFYKGVGQPTPPEFESGWQAFVAEHRDSVRLERVRRWPKGRDGKPRKPSEHPDRWTGNSLSKDVIIADRLEGGTSLRKIYEIDVRYAQWMIHGSGFHVSDRFAEERYYELSAHLRRGVSALMLVATQQMFEWLPGLDTPENRRLLSACYDRLAILLDGEWRHAKHS